MLSWEKKGVHLTTKYVLEYVTNAKDFETIWGGHHPAPWELYKTSEFDSLDDAFCAYAYRLVDDGTFEARLWEQTYLNGEMLREVFVEPSRNFLGYICKITGGSLYEDCCRMSEEIERKDDLLEKYQEFVSRYHGEKMFDAFLKEKS